MYHVKFIRKILKKSKKIVQDRKISKFTKISQAMKNDYASSTLQPLLRKYGSSPPEGVDCCVVFVFESIILINSRIVAAFIRVKLCCTHIISRTNTQIQSCVYHMPYWHANPRVVRFPIYGLDVPSSCYTFRFCNLHSHPLHVTHVLSGLHRTVWQAQTWFTKHGQS